MFWRYTASFKFRFSKVQDFGNFELSRCVYENLMLIANALMLLINIHTDASGEAIGINCVLSLYLHLNFVFKHMHRLA